MQISSYYSLLLDSNRNIFHRLKTAFRKVSSVTRIAGFIKSLAGDAISTRPVILPNQLEEKMWISREEFLNLQEISLASALKHYSRYFLALEINLILAIKWRDSVESGHTTEFNIVSSLSVIVDINVSIMQTSGNILCEGIAKGKPFVLHFKNIQRNSCGAEYWWFRLTSVDEMCISPHLPPLFFRLLKIHIPSTLYIFLAI